MRKVMMTACRINVCIKCEYQAAFPGAPLRTTPKKLCAPLENIVLLQHSLASVFPRLICVNWFQLSSINYPHLCLLYKLIPHIHLLFSLAFYVLPFLSDYHVV